MNTPAIALRIELDDASATIRLGVALSSVVEPGDVVLAIGGLGVGKTTLAAGLSRGLGATKAATSPTFALCHIYDSEPVLMHVDCWRLDDPAELDDLALDEALDDGAVAYIEWGDLASARFGSDALSVTLSDRDGGSRRIALLEPRGAFVERTDALCAALLREGLVVREIGAVTR